jgi:hypothetical protein
MPFRSLHFAFASLAAPGIAKRVELMKMENGIFLNVRRRRAVPATRAQHGIVCFGLSAADGAIVDSHQISGTAQGKSMEPEQQRGVYGGGFAPRRLAARAHHALARDSS